MSWPQWPGSGPPPIVNPAPTISTDMWQQMQQQNWQQWAQWQQQYQQWQQTYGAEFQKALAGQQPSMPVQTTQMGIAPPLPHEAKPPLPPPDAPQSLQSMAYPPPANPYSSLPPGYNQSKGYSTVPQSSTNPYNTLPPTNPYSSVPPTQQANYTTAPPPVQVSYTAPPPSQTAPQKLVNDWQRSNENKRPSTQAPTDTPLAKKPMVEKEQGEKNPEELTEAEKKFDIQFAQWEAQFNTWKQNNIDHPDKEQYREYEKKWEAWRIKLIERREQMRRKRLSLTTPSTVTNTTSVTTAPTSTIAAQKTPTFNVPPPILGKTQNKQDNVEEKRGLFPAFSGSNSYSQPSPDKNNQPLMFKIKPEEESGSFLQTTEKSVSGIPGLDLVGVGNAEEEAPLVDKTVNYEALSKGISNILGDPKLMNILSNISTSVNSIQNNSQDKTIHEPSDFKSPSNFDDQTQSSFTGETEKDYLASENYQNKPDVSSNNDFYGRLDSPFEKPYNMRPNPDFSKAPPNFGQRDQDFAIRHPSNYDRDYHGSNQENRPPKQDFCYNTPPKNDYGPPSRDFNCGPLPDQDFSKAPPNFGRLPTQNTDFVRNSNQNFDRPPPLDYNRESSFKSKFTNNQDYNRGPNTQQNYGQRFEPLDCQRRFDGVFNSASEMGRNMKRDFNDKRGMNFEDSNLNYQQSDKGPNEGMLRSQEEKNIYEDPKYDHVSFNTNRFQSYGNKSLTDNYEPFHEDYNVNDKGEDSFNKFKGPPKPLMNDRFGRPPLLGHSPGYNKMMDNFGSQGQQFSQQTFSPIKNEQHRGAFNEVPQPPNISNRNNFENNQCFPEQDNSNFGSEDWSQNDKSSVKLEDTNETIWIPTKVIEYAHKTKTAATSDILVQPYQMFDYRHKALSRIPFSERPKWLTDTIRMIPEFDPPNVRSTYARIDYSVLREENFYEMRRGYNRASKDSRKFVDLGSERGNRLRFSPPPLNKRRYDERDNKRRYENNSDRDGWYNERENKKRYDEKDVGKNNEDRDENKRLGERDDKRRHDRKYEDTKYPKEKRYDRSPDDKRKSSDRDKYYSRDRSFEREDHRLQRKPDETNKDKTLKYTKSPKGDIHESLNQEKTLFPPTSKNVVKKENNITPIDDILNPPGRYTRPPRIVIILRGPPGSGKTYLAKMIRNKEIEHGGSRHAPRILSLDDYFMVEQEKEVIEDGKSVKVKEMVYEFEAEMEESYRLHMMKWFKKTITDGYFSFIIVDNINEKVKYFGEMWSFAKQNGFQVYICQLELNLRNCTERNIHNRSEADIKKIIDDWEATPSHHPMLDPTSLLEGDPISEIEMEEITSTDGDHFESEEREDQVSCSSKWDNFDCSDNNLARLDGVSKPLRPSRTMEEYLQLNDWVPTKSTKPGQKRVRWADLEEQKQQEKMRAIGFVVGQTDWDRMMDPTMGSSALTQTKYIESVRRI